MSLSLPKLTSREDNLNPYCNFIEYTCFVEGEMFFDEFDIDEGRLELKDVIQELNRRLELYDSFVPYRIKRDSIVSLLDDKIANLHYFYCLYYAIQGGNSIRSITNLFEEITNVCLLNYFGTTNSHLTSIGQNSQNLLKAIEYLPSIINEKKGSFEEIAVQAKDGGIDIITFKPFDSRSNQVVCLTDATIGKNWLTEKFVMIKLEHWKTFIHFKVNPISCLSIVHIVDDKELFYASKNNGLIFDRARLMRNFVANPELTQKLNNWVTTLA